MAADDSRPSVRRAFSMSFLMSTASGCTLEFLTSSNSSSGCLAASIPVQGVLLAQPLRTHAVASRTPLLNILIRSRTHNGALMYVSQRITETLFKP